MPGIQNYDFIFYLGSGDAQTLCITDDDNVWSWGDGDYGKLGRGGSDGCKIPMKVDSLAGLGNKLTSLNLNSRNLSGNFRIAYTSIFWVKSWSRVLQKLSKIIWNVFTYFSFSISWKISIYCNLKWYYIGRFCTDQLKCLVINLFIQNILCHFTIWESSFLMLFFVHLLEIRLSINKILMGNRF